jgi:S-formylglutathione hydrolase
MRTNRSRALLQPIFGFALARSSIMGMPGVLFSNTPPSQHGTVKRIKVHGASLEGNLEADSPDRDVSVYLPPGYTAHKQRRLPVIYLLHGYTDNDANWFGTEHFVDTPAAIDKALASGSAREMIVVMPNAYTVYAGSMYSNSATTGNWEAFITRDLVADIDSHYRTIPNRASRGLAGHSMGGYGTMRLGMKYPDVFSSIYAMSSCCLIPDPNLPLEATAKAETVHSAADLAKTDFGTRLIIAWAAAWSPNLNNPPLYLDLPTVDGAPQPLVAAQWDANTPLRMLDQYALNLKQLHAIGLDVGTKDDLMASNQEFDQRLTAFGIPHTFETYEGTHISGIQERLEKHVLPFFSNNLSFGPTKR